jgi:murein DD-endopeptidase MepM/ murein hydrolase activator NlpD
MKRKWGRQSLKNWAILLCFLSVFTIRAPANADSPKDLINDSTNTSSTPFSSSDENQGNGQPPTYVQRYDTPLALTPQDHFMLAQPILYDNLFWTSADYRYGYYVKDQGTLHRGLDLPAIEGTPILASGDGEVVFAGYGLVYGAGAKNDPYGIVVKIRHTLKHNGSVVYSVYCHMEKNLVEVGDWVITGQMIGTGGMTGMTSGPHLHYEVRIFDELGQRNQNPELWLSPAVDHGAITGRIENRYGYLLNGWKFILSSLEMERYWVVQTYDHEIIEYKETDPFFQENYVLTDLPAGMYQFSMWYNGVFYSSTIEIRPGVVNYVNFNGLRGFEKSLPPGSINTDFLN